MSLKPFRSLLIIIIIVIIIIIMVIIIIVIIIIIFIIIVIIIIIIVFIRECRSESCKTSAHGTCSFSDIFLQPTIHMLKQYLLLRLISVLVK